ncbi:MAG TPA: DUF1926 domain-containing protein [Candidatus Treponema faecavium]|nr:DUF1926 domain-containing protein [Candidatus Treponema faecavium]
MERIYSEVFAPLYSLLYAHPQCYWAFYFPGPQLEWFKRFHPEYIELGAEMSKRKQIEFIGGGFYEPIMPLLLPSDRVAQLELMTTTLRHIGGKRPRGAKLICDIWDPSLIPTFYRGSFEYILLDSSLIPSGYEICYPLLAEELGKTICVLPETQLYLPQDGETPRVWLDRVSGALPKTDVPAAAVCRFDISLCTQLIQTGWLQELCTILPSYADTLAAVLPSKYVRSVSQMTPVYIPPSIHKRLAQPLPVSSDTAPVSIQEWLIAHPHARNFYMKMINTSNYIYQSRGGDKARKISAHEQLYKAQSGTACLGLGKYGVPGTKQRYEAYRNLLQAKRYIKEAENRTSVSGPLRYDMNADGRVEYIFEQPTYTACITQTGGSIFMLDVLDICCTSGAMRETATTGTESSYARNLFVDHLIDPALLGQYLSGESVGDPIFASCRYTDKPSELSKKDLQLIANGYYGKKQQPVSLCKRYVCAPNGIQVRFVLSNTGDEPIAAVFATELTFEIAAASSKSNGITTEILLSDNSMYRTELPESEHPVCYADISFMRLSNQAANISFAFEPNEQAGYCQYPISFSEQHDSISGHEQLCAAAEHALSCTFYWHVEIEPHHNIEKTLSMGINTASKRRKSENSHKTAGGE